MEKTNRRRFSHGFSQRFSCFSQGFSCFSQAFLRFCFGSSIFPYFIVRDISRVGTLQELTIKYGKNILKKQRKAWEKQEKPWEKQEKRWEKPWEKRRRCFFPYNIVHRKENTRPAVNTQNPRPYWLNARATVPALEISSPNPIMWLKYFCQWNMFYV